MIRQKDGPEYQVGKKRINDYRDEILKSRDLIIPESTKRKVEEKIERRIKAINRFKSLN